MAIDHEQLARELEEKFAGRFTDKDECYVKELNSRPVSPPCIYPYFNHQNRGRYNQQQHNRPDNSRYYNQHNSSYNNSYNNYPRQNPYGQHNPGAQSNPGHHNYDSERSTEYKKRRHD